MAYHEYTYGHRLHRRSYAGNGRFSLPSMQRSEEYQRTADELATRLMERGESFYSWASTIPDHVVGSERAFLEAMRGKLLEMDHEKWFQPYLPCFECSRNSP